jgi:hypothetical protein
LDLRILSTPQRVGRGAARNLGIASARAEIVVLLDDDMVPVPGFLAAHLAAQQQHRSVCRGPVRELPSLVFLDDLDRMSVDPRLAKRPSLPRVRAWAARVLDQVDRDPEQAFHQLGVASRLERDGSEAWDAGSVAGGVVAFAGANLSAPRQWLLRQPFDERPGPRWGLEDLALVLRLALEGRQLAVADTARALHLSHHRGDWRQQLRDNKLCLDFLDATSGEALSDYLEGALPLEAVEKRLAPKLELARRRTLRAA